MRHTERKPLTWDERFGFYKQKSQALRQRAPIQGNTMRRPYMNSICVYVRVLAHGRRQIRVPVQG